MLACMHAHVLRGLFAVEYIRQVFEVLRYASKTYKWNVIAKLFSKTIDEEN